MNDQLKVATRLLTLVGLAMGLGCTTHSELPSTTVQPPSEFAKIEQEVPKITKPDVTVPGPHNVLIMGRVVIKNVDFGGCPKVFAVNIVNKNGSKSHNSKTFNVPDEMARQILPHESLPPSSSLISLNGFQVLTDKDGFYSVCDKVDNVLQEVSYELVSLAHLKGCNSQYLTVEMAELRSPDVVFGVNMLIGSIKPTPDNPLSMISFPHVKIETTKPKEYEFGAKSDNELRQHFQNTKCP